jgi:signal-transduction protein with cAMP-binding, CBS, and nucleotidyltransferase domain
MDKPISSMMVEQAMSVDMDATIEEVEETLRAGGVSALPVTERARGTVIGLISARDLLRFHSEKKNPAAIHAWELCTYKPIEVGPDVPVGEVAKLMVTRDVHQVVVTEDHEIRGIVSALDFVKQFVREA